MEAAGEGGGAVPDGAGGIAGQVERDPGHAVAVGGVFHPPIFGAFGVAFFEGFGVVAFAPGADFGAEPGGDEFTGCGSTGRVGASGSKKCATKAAAPAGPRPSVSSAMILACCQEMVPADREAMARGREHSWRDWLMNAPAAPELGPA